MKKIISIFFSALLLMACRSHNTVEQSIDLSSTMVVLQVGQDTIIEAVVSPKGTAVEWTSEDEQVAVVFSGIIAAVGEGSTTVIA